VSLWKYRLPVGTWRGECSKFPRRCSPGGVFQKSRLTAAYPPKRCIVMPTLRVSSIDRLNIRCECSAYAGVATDLHRQKPQISPPRSHFWPGSRSVRSFQQRSKENTTSSSGRGDHLRWASRGSSICNRLGAMEIRSEFATISGISNQPATVIGRSRRRPRAHL